MELNKATRYALYAATDMAAAGDETVTVQEVAHRWRVPAAALAKSFQRLVRAGIATGTRGAKGGYRLAKLPSRVTVLDVVSAFQMSLPSERCAMHPGSGRACTAASHCRLNHLFHEVDEAIRNTFASVTLATLAGSTLEAGLAARLPAGPVGEAPPAVGRRATPRAHK